MDIKKMVDKANVKETVAIVLGNTGARLADNLIERFIQDENQKTAAKVGLGLIGAYAFNELAEKYPDYGEIFALAGLAASAVAAQPISDRLTAEVSAAVGSPVLVVSRGIEVGEVTGEEVKKKPTKGVRIGR